VAKNPPISRRYPKSARFASIETLCRIQQQGLPVKPVMDGIVGQCRLTAEDRALAMQLVYGVLRQRQFLETLIKRMCRHQLTKLSPFVLHSLEIGLYQLFLLDRIPESAAVNETVNAVKAAGLPQRLQGFVNGVLRESIRQRASLPDNLADPETGEPYLNHPSWLTDRWRRHFGETEMRRICSSNTKEPSLVVKVNTLKTSKEQYRSLLDQTGIPHREGIFAPDALVLLGYHGSIPQLPGYDDGLFLIQDEATQLAPLLLGPFRRGGRYLDACAGLGGKTALLLEMEKQLDLRIFALEPEVRRYAKMAENLQRLHPDNRCETRHCTLQEFAATDGSPFDGILVDAPCSGTGVTGRHPDIRWNRREEDIPRYQAMQLDILDKAAPLVAENGILLYATCSLEPEENQEVVRHFLATHPRFELTDPAMFLPPAAHRLIDNQYFCPRPDTAIDGFFAARLLRR
jgi:16S rRNA (cytosine967-C5)-methyltransferase